MKLSNEAKVGGLILVTTVLTFLFAWIVGVNNPFSATQTYYVTYNFAGGIEVGSPVRVSGIKVGRVERIEFFQPVPLQAVSLKEPGSAPVSESDAISPLKIKISVQKDAAVGIREDSRFYINLAGIIGERYIEVLPGSLKRARLEEGAVVPGIDPPRIDQLISQSFDLAGKIKKLIDENEGDITRSIELLYKLSANFNKTLGWIEKSALFKTDLSQLVGNLIAITGDVKTLTNKIQSPEGEKTLELLHQLLWRLEPLDSKTVREFFQKEGMKVHFF